jgi:hypothetical protein
MSWEAAAGAAAHAGLPLLPTTSTAGHHSNSFACLLRRSHHCLHNPPVPALPHLQMLSRVASPYQAHHEMQRILKPGGTHIFTVPFSPVRRERGLQGGGMAARPASQQGAVPCPGLALCRASQPANPGHTSPASLHTLPPAPPAGLPRPDPPGLT